MKIVQNPRGARFSPVRSSRCCSAPPHASSVLLLPCLFARCWSFSPHLVVAHHCSRRHRRCSGPFIFPLSTSRDTQSRAERPELGAAISQQPAPRSAAVASICSAAASLEARVEMEVRQQCAQRRSSARGQWRGEQRSGRSRADDGRDRCCCCCCRLLFACPLPSRRDWSSISGR